MRLVRHRLQIEKRPAPKTAQQGPINDDQLTPGKQACRKARSSPVLQEFSPEGGRPSQEVPKTRVPPGEQMVGEVGRNQVVDIGTRMKH